MRINNLTFHCDVKGFPERFGADAVPAVTTPTPLLIFLPAFTCERASAALVINEASTSSESSQRKE